MTTLTTGRWLLVALAVAAVALAPAMVSAHGNGTTAGTPPDNGTAADWAAWMEGHMARHMGPGAAGWMDAGTGPGYGQDGTYGPGYGHGTYGAGYAQGGMGPGYAQNGTYGAGYAQGGMGPGYAQGGMGPGYGC